VVGRVVAYRLHIFRRDSTGPGSGVEETIIPLDSDEFGEPEEEFRYRKVIYLHFRCFSCQLNKVPFMSRKALSINFILYVNAVVIYFCTYTFWNFQTFTKLLLKINFYLQDQPKSGTGYRCLCPSSR
jgi:hypothetical protein